MPMRPAAFALALILCLSAMLAVFPSAGRTAEFQFNLFTLDGLVVGDTYNIDADYGAKYGVTVHAPFKFLVPREDGIVPLFETPTGDDGMLLKVHYATEDREPIENMQFVRMTLPLVEREERLTALARLLANDGYNQVVANYPQNEYMGTREAKVGDYDAVEVIGKYIDPTYGLMYTRIVGIPNPNAPESVFVVSNIVADRVPLESVDDLARTMTGTSLRFFEYLEQ